MRSNPCGVGFKIIDVKGGLNGEFGDWFWVDESAGNYGLQCPF